MDYDLALQLKEAGYMQTYLNGNWIESPLKTMTVYAPTLEELIEDIVGDKPNSFYLQYNDEWSVYQPVNPLGKWNARYYDLTPVGCYEAFGQSPIEAVAELWLALNKSECDHADPGGDFSGATNEPGFAPFW